MYVNDGLGAYRAGGGNRGAGAVQAPRVSASTPAPRAGRIGVGTQRRIGVSMPAGASPTGVIGGTIGQATRALINVTPAQSPRLVPGLRILRMSDRTLAGYDGEDVLQGLSLKGIFKGISNAGKAVGKAVTQVGHVVGEAATSKIGQAVEGVALAATGVGIPAAAAIMGASKGIGNLIKPGGNLAHAATGLAQGAVEGAAASVAGSLARDAINKLRGTGSTPTAVSQVATTAATNNIPGLSSVAALPAELTPSLLTPAGIAAGVIPAVLPQQVYQRQGGGGSTYGVARGILRGGQAANTLAQGGASDANSIAQKALDIAQAAAAAQKIGDASGASTLANLAQQLQAQALNVAGGANTAGVDLSALGTAAQGAAGGAVAGGAVGGLSQFFDNNKVLLIGGAGLIAALLFLPRTGASSSSRRTA